MICACTETSRADTASSQTTKLGPQGKRARDADPLSLPAGEFMRIALRGRTRQADKIQHLEHRFRTRCAIADAMDHIGFR